MPELPPDMNCDSGNGNIYSLVLSLFLRTYVNGYLGETANSLLLYACTKDV